MNIQNFEKWAKVYDLIYGKHKDDIDFYRKEARKAKGKVLEIACGTGRIYLEILKDGVDAYGIDISGNMLKILEKKAKDLGLKPRVQKADMRTFKLKNKFSLIIIPFRSFLHNLTIKDQIKTLRNIKNYLTTNGKLILNFYYPDPCIVSQTKDKPKRIRKGTFFIDRINQIIETVGDNKLGFRTSFIYKREFELLLLLAGFKKWEVCGSFDRKHLKSYRQEMIWIIEK